MTLKQYMRIIPGAFIMISLALAHCYGQADLGSLSWLWFTAFVGANLFQSGFTKFCLMENILRAIGVKDAAS